MTDIFDHIQPDEQPETNGSISQFIATNFLHYNAGTLTEAAGEYKNLIDSGGKMFISMAGAMSTAELGISLAKMIRADKVHAISCTGANLEEDIFRLVAGSKYVEIPGWRNLSPQDDSKLLAESLPRVTDSCIPENAAMDKISGIVEQLWKEADDKGEPMFPHEFLYAMIRAGSLKGLYDNDPAKSWMLAACDKNIPIYVPGWEDSTLGNVFASKCLRGEIKNPRTVRGGVEYMMNLCEWYQANSNPPGIGFFQIGGGIAGDFAICVVPLLKVDMKLEDKIPLWSYFCQISESNTSYGGYSGATPNEKITWYKLGEKTPRFVIESDATIVAPLIFAYVLGE